MSIDEIERPTPRDDYNRSLKNKENTKTGQSSQQAGRVKEKSAFEKVLENFTQGNISAQGEAARSFNNRIQDALSDDNRREDQGKRSGKEERSEDKKKTGSDSENKETNRSKEGGVKDRVLGKQEGGEQKSSSQGGSEDSGSSSKQFGQRQFRQSQTLSPGEMASAQKIGNIENILTAKATEANRAGQIPKQVLDQIVQSIRIGVNKNLDKEIQVDLSEKIFRGLSLKVSSHKGKVEIYFITGDPAVRRVFENRQNQESIRQALKEKNIQTSHIQVQFLG